MSFESYLPTLVCQVGACIAILIWNMVMLAHLVAIFYGRKHLHTHRRQECSGNQRLSHEKFPGVSIIRPISGMSESLIANLESLFLLQYPKYEILICVQDANHDVIPHVQQLIQKYPRTDARISAGAPTVGINPKINNMMQLYPLAKYPFIWICDSGIRANSNLLAELTSHLTPQVGMVHQLPYLAASGSFAACLEKMYFGTQHARWYLAFSYLGCCCVNGMSNLVNKQYLDEVGGLKAFSDYIAEDYFMSNALFRRGYKIVLSTEPALQSPDLCSVMSFIHRMTRWNRLRLTMEPISVLEPFSESFLIGFLAAGAANYLWSWNLMNLFLSHILLWFVLDEVLLYLVQGSYWDLPPLWKRCLAWLLRETVTYYVILLALWSKRISWRAGTFKVMIGGRAKRIEHKQS